MENKYIVHIVYGSQTGNSEEIAHQLYERILTNTYSHIASVDCKVLNEWTETFTTQWSEEGAILIVICSTTGNGDAPNNACHFWRKFKKRTLPKETLKNTQFAVVGLGDSNYDKFCNMGKQLNRRFTELSSKQVHELVCIDEVMGLEEQIEPCLDNLIETIQNLY